jgi:tetratricopeptide (TPR) repeat protein
MLGLVLEDQGKLDEAMAEFREALRLKPNFADPHNMLGLVLEDQGKLDEAMAEFREALRLEPNLADPHGNLGNVWRAQGKLAEAIAEYREALRLKPNFAKPHGGLGNVLQDQGKVDEAIAEYREALRLEPNDLIGHINLGGALRDKGKVDEASVEYRTALRLKPDSAAAHLNFGATLADQGKLTEAIAEFREALRLNRDLFEAHANLGLCLRSQGEFTEAVAELRKARDLARANPGIGHVGKANPRQVQVIEAGLAATERQASLAGRLPVVLAGKLKPADDAETLGFAELCYKKKLHGASARFWTEAFQAQPKLADDMQAQHRYNAACAAALAGSGQGKDEPPLDEPTKARWRKQAIDWLKADLAAWSQVVRSGPQQARQFVAQALQHWKVDPDLAGLRDPAMLAKLPMSEQAPWRDLWSAVDRLLEQAQGRPSK